MSIIYGFNGSDLSYYQFISDIAYHYFQNLAIVQWTTHEATKEYGCFRNVEEEMALYLEKTEENQEFTKRTKM